MNELFLKAPYNRFEEFISAGADRLTLLVSILEENGLPPQVLRIAGKNHIALNWPCGVQAARRVILSAHYDRAPGSPGANDNSAAVFMLIKAAMELQSEYETESLPCFIFTDKEELLCGEGIEEQGSYSLAQYLRKQRRGTSPVFCFDLCGAGDTVIISTAADMLLKNRGSAGSALLRHRMRQLRGAALNASRKSSVEKVLLLPTPFSEDAGFLKAGVAAQTITVLPASEAAAFASLVRTKPETAAALVADSGRLPEDLRPETWRTCNSPTDTPCRLTTKHWKTIVRYIKTLYAT